HERVEGGEAVTAGTLGAITADLFAEAFGDEVEVDRERVGVTWAQYPHLTSSFYVFQYATGIAGANALAARMLDGEPGAADDALSGQLGAAVAVKAFDQVGPLGVAFGRIVFAALALALFVRATRSGAARPGRAGLRTIAAFGVALAVMNTTFYEGIARLPLA